jgi:hypothetical protein
MGTKGSFLGGRMPGWEVDYSLPCSAGLWNEWSLMVSYMQIYLKTVVFWGSTLWSDFFLCSDTLDGCTASIFIVWSSLHGYWRDIRHDTTGCANPKDHPHFDNCHENLKNFVSEEGNKFKNTSWLALTVNCNNMSDINTTAWVLFMRVHTSRTGEDEGV